MYTIESTQYPNHTNTQDKYNKGLVLRRREERSLINTSFLDEYECSSLALELEGRDEKKRLDHLKQDLTDVVFDGAFGGVGDEEVVVGECFGDNFSH
ncbi:hypothetical protein Tco_1438303 [Tanacetum coccineum]